MLINCHKPSINHPSHQEQTPQTHRNQDIYQKKKSDEWLSMLPLNQWWGISPDPNCGRRWQVWTILFAQIMAAFGQWCQVEWESLNIPNCGSQAWKGVNQWTYVRGSEKHPNCESSVKITWISATQRPVQNATSWNYNIPTIFPSS